MQTVHCQLVPFAVFGLPSSEIIAVIIDALLPSLWLTFKYQWNSTVLSHLRNSYLLELSLKFVFEEYINSADLGFLGGLYICWWIMGNLCLLGAKPEPLSSNILWVEILCDSNNALSVKEKYFKKFKNIFESSNQTVKADLSASRWRIALGGRDMFSILS